MPLVGSGAETLRNLIRKDICQSILTDSRIPVPASRVIRRGQADSQLHEHRAFSPDFPLVLKPTAEAASRGVCLVHSQEELEREMRSCLKRFPESDVLLEEFLPSEDITCGFIQLGNEALLFPSYYLIEGLPGEANVLSQEARDLSWAGGAKTMETVYQEGVLTQLQRWLPEIVKALTIRDVTRVDGRLDRAGTLRFFDVNGYPGLGVRESTGVAQVRSFYPDHDPVAVYTAYLYTIFANACLRHGLPAPASMRDHNLFTLSGYGVRGCE